jgi:hypothetical protein
VAVIPEQGTQADNRKRRGSAGGRPVGYDRDAYPGRNVIERAFNGFKHWRGLATRYDKHAIVYRGGLVLAASLTWLADLGKHVLVELSFASWTLTYPPGNKPLGAIWRKAVAVGAA